MQIDLGIHEHFNNIFAISICYIESKQVLIVMKEDTKIIDIIDNNIS